MQDNNKKLKRIFYMISGMAVLVMILFLFFGTGTEDANHDRPIVTIAIPADEYRKELETGYYKLWLQEHARMELRLEFIPRQYMDEYLRLLFASERSDIDTVFFPSGDPNSVTGNAVSEYGRKGYILPLEPYIDSYGENTARLFENHETYNLRKLMTAPDGHIYAMPNLEQSKIQNHAQVLWMNVNWLKALEMPVPSTAAEFREVLKAFRERDPNRNGKQDEIPMVGCQDEYALQSHNFIINGFVYNDPDNSRMFIKDGRVCFAPVTDAWREALSFCRRLYDEGLFHNISFTFTKSQMMQLINDPRDLVGAFTSRRIRDVIDENSPEVLARYIHVPPIEGIEGVRFSTVKTPLPGVGAVITSACKSPEVVFRLLDLMLSEEASLIGHFGQRGTDWDYGKVGDISMFGTPAIIHAMNPVPERLQNSHFMGIGPSFISAEYLDGVTWSGFQYDQEYITARAAVSYQRYAPLEYIDTIHFEGPEIEHYQQLRQKIEAYTDSMLISFITGEKDILNDGEWQATMEATRMLGLEEYIQAVSRAYNALEVKDGEE